MNLFEDFLDRNGYDLDLYFIHKGKTVIGIDEVGRGPLAGPVVTCAIILNYQNKIEGLNDSKKLSQEQRERLFPAIINNSLKIGIGMSFPAEIDVLNIYQATICAMKKAVMHTKIKEGVLLIDGLSFPYPGCESFKIIKGDTKSPAIMAASIIAKVTRDRLMNYYDRFYTGYDFKKHKGYGTASHMGALEKLGPCPIHRKSFEPIKSMLKKII